MERIVINKDGILCMQLRWWDGDYQVEINEIWEIDGELEWAQ